MEVSDADVVAQVLAGDQDAFRVLVTRHSRSVYAVVYRMAGNPQDTEEILQETDSHQIEKAGARRPGFS